jgi:hypothetical protein
VPDPASRSVWVWADGSALSVGRRSFSDRRAPWPRPSGSTRSASPGRRGAPSTGCPSAGTVCAGLTVAVPGVPGKAAAAAFPAGSAAAEGAAPACKRPAPADPPPPLMPPLAAPVGSGSDATMARARLARAWGDGPAGREAAAPPDVAVAAGVVAADAAPDDPAEAPDDAPDVAADVAGVPPDAITVAETGTPGRSVGKGVELTAAPSVCRAVSAWRVGPADCGPAAELMAGPADG